MPTSPYGHIGAFVNYILKIRPKTMLDIGLGNGKLGFIVRDIMDVGINESYHKRDWKLTIDGIEIFEDYIQPHQQYIYDDIHIGDAFDIIDGLGHYDVIVIGDILEHFPKEKGQAFFDKCMAHTLNHIILCIPLGENWVQPEMYGNPHESHQSTWELSEFKPYTMLWEVFPYENGPHGIFLIQKEEYLDYRIAGLK